MTNLSNLFLELSENCVTGKIEKNRVTPNKPQKSLIWITSGFSTKSELFPTNMTAPNLLG